MTLAPIETLDLRGLKCPLPVLRARKYLSQQQHGHQVTILTTDPLAVIDIPHMCHEDGHSCSALTRVEAENHFHITVGTTVA